MYNNFCENHGWKIDLMDFGRQAQEELKEIIFNVMGESVYGQMKYKSGVPSVPSAAAGLKTPGTVPYFQLRRWLCYQKLMNLMLEVSYRPQGSVFYYSPRAICEYYLFMGCKPHTYFFWDQS